MDKTCAHIVYLPQNACLLHCAHGSSSRRRGGLFSIFVVFCVCFMAGCENKAPVVITTPKASKTAMESLELKNFKERCDQLFAPIPYTYNSSGKPDPFQPFLKASLSGGRPETCSTPLECIDLGQLRLVAVITKSDGKRIAMVQDAAGMGYIVRKGIGVGYNKGVVKDILPDRVIVEEETEDVQGHSMTRERILVLHPEEQ